MNKVMFKLHPRFFIIIANILPAVMQNMIGFANNLLIPFANCIRFIDVRLCELLYSEPDPFLVI
jgi:hypothetical protein